MDAKITPVEVPIVQTSGQPEAPVAAAPAADAPMPILEAAKQLGGDYWVRNERIGAKGVRVLDSEGPGWVLAGVMAGHHLDENSLVTKAELVELGDAVRNIQIGVHTHQPAKKGA